MYVLVYANVCMCVLVYANVCMCVLVYVNVCMCVLISAQRHGLLCEVEDNEDTDKDEFCEPFFAHCKAHADKDLMKRKVKKQLVGMASCVGMIIGGCG